MATDDSKRFYWLKLRKDFFDDYRMKVLKSRPNGRLYALIYLELLAESTSHEGELRFSETLPYDSVTLAAVIDEDKDNLEKAIETLVGLELVEILDDQTIYMREIQKMIGSETGQTMRKKLSGVKNTPMLPQTYQKSTQEIRVKSKEIRDKNKEKSKKESHFVPPTYEEVSAYCNERNNFIDAERFIDFYSSKGWMVGRNKMKDWKACVRTWEKRDTKPVEDVPYRPNYDAVNEDTDTENLERFLKERTNNG